MAKKLLYSLLMGILAGIAIGLGGFLFIISTTYISGDLGKAIGALLFPIGLFMVCTFGLHLYTGKIGLVFESKQEKSFYLSLPIMFIGNLIGSLIIGFIFLLLFKNLFGVDEIVARANAIAQGKNTFNSFNDYLATFLKSVFCGVCVYLAVKGFALNRLKVKGIVILFFFIFLFVFAGFEHVVANMFYFTFGEGWLTWGSVFNILICLVGNSIGTIPGVLLIKLINKKNEA